MLTAIKYATDLYTPNEGALLVTPLHSPSLAEKRAVICVHGRGASAVQWVPGTFVGDHAQYLADQGFAVLSVDAGGPYTWNNDTAMTAITAAYNWLVAQGTLTKVGLMGWSMGGGNSLQWMKQNPTKVAAAALWAPMSSLPYYYGSGDAEIEAAYGGNYAVNSVGHRISDEYATWRDKAPIRIWHGTSDASVPLSLSQAFVNGVGQSQVDVVAVSGADHTTVLLQVPMRDVYTFLLGGSW